MLSAFESRLSIYKCQVCVTKIAEKRSPLTKLFRQQRAFCNGNTPVCSVHVLTHDFSVLKTFLNEYFGAHGLDQSNL